jgi:hypothetical protein
MITRISNSIGVIRVGIRLSGLVGILIIGIIRVDTVIRRMRAIQGICH